MSLYLMYAFSLSVLIGGTIAIIRFNQISHAYRPFIYLLWIACTNEIINVILLSNGQYNIVNSNIYDLTESLLWLWFFSNLGVLKRWRSLVHVLSAVFITAWIFENFILRKFGNAFDSYFIIIYSLPVVLLGINWINELLLREKDLIKNPGFLISISVVIFYTYRVLVETFWIYGLDRSVTFQNNVYNILIYINLLCNLIYAIAVIWMRKKQAYTLRF